MIGKNMFAVALFAFSLSLTIPALAEQQAFTEKSIALIKKHYENEPFLLAIWSVECPPCRDELALFGELKQAGEKFNLVLVATDDFNQQAALDAILAEYRLEEVDAWAFADSNTEKLRYQLDPDWFGEMPRSYFYDASHNPVAVSGKLARQTIREWLNLMGS